MGYSDRSDSVRVDFFRTTGKWYSTEAVVWTGQYNGGLIHDEFARSLRDHLRRENGSYRHEKMVAVCLEPYHQHAHPLMMEVDRAVAMDPARLSEGIRGVCTDGSPAGGLADPLSEDQSAVLGRLLKSLACRTGARWDQHLRYDVGDEQAEPIIEWVHQHLMKGT